MEEDVVYIPDIYGYEKIIPGLEKEFEEKSSKLLSDFEKFATLKIKEKEDKLNKTCRLLYLKRMGLKDNIDFLKTSIKELGGLVYKLERYICFQNQFTFIVNNFEENFNNEVRIGCINSVIRREEENINRFLSYIERNYGDFNLYFTFFDKQKESIYLSNLIKLRKKYKEKRESLSFLTIKEMKEELLK